MRKYALLRLILLALITALVALVILRALQPEPGGLPAVIVPTPQPTRKPNLTPVPTRTAVADGAIAPYLGAPRCPDTGKRHNLTDFHTLWDSVRGCHYDHEHGQNPFTPDVAAAFPGFDLKGLLGGVEIGNSNPSSAMENTHKHGGFKWQVQPYTPEGCAVIENGQIAVNGAVIEYHAFGPQSIEFEANIHSTAALLRFCRPGHPGDVGYMYTTLHQNYGERCAPYQGETIPYPDNFQPPWDCAFGPYFTTPCGYGEGGVCTATRQDILSRNRDASSIWTSKVTGTNDLSLRPQGSRLFTLLFRVRDSYQLFDRRDFVHPFTWEWLCSDNSGLSFAPIAGCRYNNSATTVHEVAGRIPAAWDNLEAFDSDRRVGRITAEGYTTRFGEINLSCTAPGPNCHPLKLVEAFVGFYSSQLSAGKVSDDDPANTPERDIYFCGGIACLETSPGAIPSGWIGAGN